MNLKVSLLYFITEYLKVSLAMNNKHHGNGDLQRQRVKFSLKKGQIWTVYRMGMMTFSCEGHRLFLTSCFTETRVLPMSP